MADVDMHSNINMDIINKMLLKPTKQAIRGYFTVNGRSKIDVIYNEILTLLSTLTNDLDIYDGCNNEFDYIFIVTPSSDQIRDILQSHFFIIAKSDLANSYMRTLKNDIHKIFATNRGFGLKSTILYPNFRFSAVVVNKPNFPQEEQLISFIQLYKSDASTSISNSRDIDTYYKSLQVVV